MRADPEGGAPVAPVVLPRGPALVADGTENAVRFTLKSAGAVTLSGRGAGGEASVMKAVGDLLALSRELVLVVDPVCTLAADAAENVVEEMFLHPTEAEMWPHSHQRQERKFDLLGARMLSIVVVRASQHSITMRRTAFVDLKVLLKTFKQRERLASRSLGAMRLGFGCAPDAWPSAAAFHLSCASFVTDEPHAVHHARPK